jgi:hypothetical protein
MDDDLQVIFRWSMIGWLKNANADKSTAFQRSLPISIASGMASGIRRSDPDGHQASDGWERHSEPQITPDHDDVWKSWEWRSGGSPQHAA